MTKAPHPAKFSPAVLTAIEAYLPQVGLVLDPFAGTGLISRLATETRKCIGVEIEAEWAEQDPCVILGDATALPFADESVACVATSPAFGNRMADKHNPSPADKSDRNTYKHKLGRDLHPNNSGAMQWGPEYRGLHLGVWREAWRVTQPFGSLVLNIKDHFRTRQVAGVKTQERQPVSLWHANALGQVGFALDSVTEIPSRGNRRGANGQVRVATEYVIRFLKMPR